MCICFVSIDVCVLFEKPLLAVLRERNTFLLYNLTESHLRLKDNLNILTLANRLSV